MRRSFIAFVWLLLMAGPAASGQPALSLTGNARQGNPLFLAVANLPAGTGGVVRWANHRFPLAEAGPDGVARTVLPVPVDMPTGKRPMVIELSDGHSIERNVPIQGRWFPTQHIGLPPETLAGYDTPQNKADDQAILDALKPMDPERRWRGNFSVPVEAPQTGEFGVKRLYNGWRKGWHKGIDLAGWEGQPVKAPAYGVVLHTARGVVNGNTVVLGHGLGVGSVYLHLSSIEVEDGQTVEKGEVIGRVGGTGGFGPHLHWEVRVHGEPVEPGSLYAIPRDWRR
ncbi:MAG: M23 family metallopeptidase [Armatimonadetes bacterium]|nr:M23 family metallopeptidase [Armatimonadota bacterium]